MDANYLIYKVAKELMKNEEVKSKFKVSDTVAVYGNSQIGALADFKNNRNTGVVTAVCNEDWINVDITNVGDYTFHVKQCRKLKIKKRREWTITCEINGFFPERSVRGPAMKLGETVRVVESSKL